MRLTVVALTAAAVTLVTAGGCASSAGREATGGTLAGLRPTLTVEQARQELQQLPVRPPGSLSGYRREAFGPPWADVDGNGCSQRSDVLFRDAQPGSAIARRRGTCGHDMLAGRWRDPYSDALLQLNDVKSLQQAEAVQIDHVVALAEAYRSGAAIWTARQRLLFANDESNLVAVSATSNLSKSDDDPARWLPQPAARCTFALVWIGVKQRWGLSIDVNEKSALARALALTCRPPVG